MCGGAEHRPEHHINQCDGLELGVRIRTADDPRVAPQIGNNVRLTARRRAALVVIVRHAHP